ncbi:MAG: hypothetical protein ACC631_09560, partial [Halocynthiibacter sp.]
RLPELERALRHRHRDVLQDNTLITKKHLAPLRPISDLRASAEYRTEAVAELCRRALIGALSDTPGHG